MTNRDPAIIQPVQPLGWARVCRRSRSKERLLSIRVDTESQVPFAASIFDGYICAPTKAGTWNLNGRFSWLSTPEPRRG